MIHFIEPAIPFDSNIYLVTGEKNALIDSGTGLTSKYVIDQIRSIIGAAGSLDYLLFTHCHFDHIGSGAALIREFGCKAYAGTVDAAAIRDGDPDYTLSKDFDIVIPPFPTEDLKDGDIIDLGGHKLLVLETPGHTRGGVCYLDKITGALFSGDTVFSNGVGRTDFNGGSLYSLRNSIKYLMDMPVRGLYPGHGPVADDGPGAIKRGLELVGD